MCKCGNGGVGGVESKQIADVIYVWSLAQLLLLEVQLLLLLRLHVLRRLHLVQPAQTYCFRSLS